MIGSRNAAKVIAVVRAVMGAIVLAGCATQQPLVHDDVDRLFLKYAEIAQRPSPTNSDEGKEIADLVHRITISGDICTATKFVRLFPVSTLMLAGMPADPVTAAELQNKKDEAKQYLKGLQKAAPSGNDCPYSGFPPVKIK